MSKKLNPLVHQPSVSHPYGTRAVLMHQQKPTSTDPQTHMVVQTYTHTHTSSLFQGSFVKMTAGLLLRRSLPGRIPRLLSGSQNILGNILTHRGCRAIVYASLSLHALCVNAQLFQTPSSTIARSSPSSVSACAWQGQTWQGAAHFVRLPVNIKSAYCSRLYPNTFPLLPFYSQLFTCLPYDISKGFLPVGLEGMYCKRFLPNSPPAKVH